MRLNKTFWIFLGVAIMIAAAVTIFMLYQGQMREQDKVNDSLAEANTMLKLLGIEKGALEEGIVQLESELAELEGETGQLEAEISQLEAELSRLEDERVQAVAQAISLLNATEAKFLSSVESIEYDEILFGFAHDADLGIAKIEVSEPSSENIEGIAYTTTNFTLTVWGDVADILDFIDTIVAYESFKTTVLDTFSMNVPEPLTDAEIDELEKTIKAELTAEAITELTTEDMVGFILEAIVEVAGPDYSIDTLTVNEIAQVIKEKIGELVPADFVDMLAGDLADLIEKYIEGAIVEKIVSPLADEIAALIASGGWEDLVELLGEDIATYLGDDIAGSIPGNIAGLLNEYISNLVEEKVKGSVEGIVEGMIDTMMAEILEEMETPSSDITLVIYTYEGE